MKETYITIAQEKVPVSYENRDIFELRFYPENPRIASIISKHRDKVNDDFIDKELWDRNETHQLKGRIERHDGLIHPVIVHGNYVIEGNTRLCAYRHLYKQAEEEGKDSAKWRHISCQVLLTTLKKKQIYELLGDEHIIGKIDWNTYEKGCWMTKMLEEEKFSHEDIKGITSLSIQTIKYHIEAYKMMITEKVEDTKKFSHFLQLVSNAEIRATKKRDPQLIDKCVEAIKDGQFKDAKDLRKVPKICKDKNAKKRLFEYGESCDEVYHSLKAMHPMIGSTFVRMAEDVCKKMLNLKRKEREEIAEDHKARNIVKKLAKESKKLYTEIQELYDQETNKQA